jgi:Multicopper oxidase
MARNAGDGSVESWRGRLWGAQHDSVVGEHSLPRNKHAADLPSGRSHPYNRQLERNLLQYEVHFPKNEPPGLYWYHSYWNGVSHYPSVTLRMDFRGPDVGDFVYHCHIRDHEDGGMMAIIWVLPKTRASESKVEMRHRRETIGFSDGIEAKALAVD